MDKIELAYLFIRKYLRQHGYMPTLEEVKRHVEENE